MAEIATRVAELRARLGAPDFAPGRTVMVPTMGALHDGHLSLVRRARELGSRVVVSIFVNPTQFAPHEDFAAYPRGLETDLAKLEGLADIVFAPGAAEMYPEGFATTISVGGPTAGLESDFRPHFFAGVATVVAKLLLAARPDAAVFGEKDYQQLLVVKRLAKDLGLATEIVGAPTLRESDGLAMSSRNAYLDPRERAVAGRLNGTLKEVIRRAGEPRAAEAWGEAALKQAGFDSVDYVAIRDAETLAVAETLDRPARVLAAARIGRTRLIDNMPVQSTR
jgi:pantoate--beta-alanine ligase